jgi:hypothetical protein
MVRHLTTVTMEKGISKMSIPAHMMMFAAFVLTALAGPAHATTAGHLFKSSTAAAAATNESVTGAVSSSATPRHGAAPANSLAPVVAKPQTGPAH